MTTRLCKLSVLFLSFETSNQGHEVDELKIIAQPQKFYINDILKSVSKCEWRSLPAATIQQCMVYLLEESRPSNKYIHEKKMGRKFKKHALGKDEKRKKSYC